VRIGLVLADADGAAGEAAAAEALGFDYVAAGDHVFFHEPVANPFVVLAAAAAVTDRVRLLTSVALLPLYAPAVAAKLAASLDRVSGGRLDLGVGAGGEYPREFDACGVPVASRLRRLDECLRVIELLAPGAPVSFDGEFGRFDDVTLAPAPLQQPRFPIWVGGRKDGARRRAARYGDVWMPYMVTPEMLRGGLAEVREAAHAQKRPGTVGGAIFAWACVDPDDEWARTAGTEFVSTMYRQDFRGLADKYLLLGSPERVVGRLREFAAAGAEVAVLAIAAPASDRRRVVETLAGSVLPALRSA
jgi:probable F420-dependent oxidoreductase